MADRQQPRQPSARAALHRLVPALCLALAPAAARAETVTLQELLSHSSKALDILVAENEYVSAQEEVNRERALQGWRVEIGGGYGATRDIIDETRTREYEAIQTQVSVKYPLLGAYARQQREIETAAGAMELKRIKRDTALRVARLELEDVYAALWGAQEGLEVIEAYLATEARLGGRLDEGDESDQLEARAGYPKARAERKRLARRLTEARSRLASLAERPLKDMVAVGVQLPAMMAIDARKLQDDHPDLAAIRARHAAMRQQLDDAVWWGIDAEFDVTQTTTTDRDDGQAGNGLFANLTVSMPLAFYKAGVAERRRLLADMELAALDLRVKSEEVVAEAQDEHAQHEALFEEVEALTKRTQAAGRSLRRQARDGGPAPRRVRDYFTLAMDEIQARTRYWRSHVKMRSFLLVGAAEPAPEPTGPTTTDVGTRLAEPLRTAFQ